MMLAISALQPSRRIVRHLALSVCLAAGVLSGQDLPAGVARAAESSTWHWLNPRPHPYSVNAIACTSVTDCVAVGNAGTTLRTSDRGQHWTAGTTGTAVDLYFVSCPSRTTCYAAGYTSGGGATANHLVKSGDGGAMWQNIPLSTSDPVQGLNCLSATTCFLNVATSHGEDMLRSADGGRTWADVFQGSRIVSVSCVSEKVCYAGTDTGRYTINAVITHAVYRSEDGGQTWQLWEQSPTETNGALELNDVACFSSGACLVVINSNTFAYADIYLIDSDGKAWKHVDHVVKHDVGSLTCIDGSTCYALTSVGTLRSTNGGQTWTIPSLPAGVPLLPLRGLVCPGAGTCYVPAGFTVVVTNDGFTHIKETPAATSIRVPNLRSIQCPTVTTCYAEGAGVPTLVATTNGGRTWTERPKLPLSLSLTCPSSTLCYGVGRDSQGPVIYRTRDGALTWQRVLVRDRGVPLTGLSCPTAETCYVGTQLLTANGKSLSVTILVSHDGGSTWTAKTAINGLTGPSCFGGCGTPPPLGSLACPGDSICFATTPLAHAVLVTRNGGQSWTVARQCTDGCGSLTCPTVTSCYLGSGQPPAPPDYAGTLLVTHNGGVTWRRSIISAPLSVGAILCTSAQTCRVFTTLFCTPSCKIITSATTFVTVDGGKTWQEQRLPPVEISGIACPAADTCYAVGGMNILVRRPSR